jgi:hypothetical protein
MTLYFVKCYDNICWVYKDGLGLYYHLAFPLTKDGEIINVQATKNPAS